jgi:hypothetical protein
LATSRSTPARQPAACILESWNNWLAASVAATRLQLELELDREPELGPGGAMPLCTGALPLRHAPYVVVDVAEDNLLV